MKRALRRRLGFCACAVLSAHALAFAADATKAAAAPSPSASATDGAASGTSAPSASDAAAKPSDAPADSTDTRGSAMRTYQTALANQKLAPTIPLSVQRLRDDLGEIEEKLSSGRRDEAIADLVYLVESDRFEAFKDSEEGRACVFWLGDALARGGAFQPARGYLTRLLAGSPTDTWYRRAVHSLVDLALESDEGERVSKDLSGVPSSAPDEVTGDIAYLSGRLADRQSKPDDALAAYARVSEKSRFWAQATYLSGVIEVERKNYPKGEALFCKVADPKLTPKKAPLFGGMDFFRVRDLARLGLGRVAHEQYRFDDARYYYYLVPQDSDDLPEALYETATTRYEAKDYDGARRAIDDLNKLKVNHAYEDETYILDAYIDLATCHFPAADRKLDAFLKRYEPVRDAARKLTQDDAAVEKLSESVRTGSDAAAAGLGVPEETARTLGALVRIDADYGRAARRLAELDHQMRGLRSAMGELDQASQKLASPKAVRGQSDTPLGQSDLDKVERIESQIAELKRLIRDAERGGNGKRAEDLDALKKEISALEIRARAARAALPPPSAKAGKTGADLAGVISNDRARATALYNDAQTLRIAVEAESLGLAKDALVRLDRRLSRLLRRARLGRIETVLGKKRSLEMEVDALSQGLLPQTIIDSLDAARYLHDDEEFWPFEGEDWADEYVGGEGVR
ncbi:MAG TPA: tetratricopeptide repeat protein [Polyangiaceae bacterium]